MMPMSRPRRRVSSRWPPPISAGSITPDSKVKWPSERRKSSREGERASPEKEKLPSRWTVSIKWVTGEGSLQLKRRESPSPKSVATPLFEDDDVSLTACPTSADDDEEEEDEEEEGDEGGIWPRRQEIKTPVVLLRSLVKSPRHTQRPLLHTALGTLHPVGTLLLLFWLDSFSRARRPGSGPHS